jgi:hypothetical protein
VSEIAKNKPNKWKVFMHEKYIPIISIFCLVLFFVLFFLFFGVLYYTNRTRLHEALLRQETRAWFNSNIHICDKLDKTPMTLIVREQYSNGLKIFDSYNDNPIPPSLFLAGLRYRDWDKSMSKIFDIMWLETGHNVEGIYLIIGDNTYEYHNVFADKFLQKYASESLYKSYGFLIKSSGAAISNADREQCIIHLPAEVLDKLYSCKDNNVQIGLLLKDHKKSATIKLWQNYLYCDSKTIEEKSSTIQQ